jgi:hypothetical protein
MRRIILILLLGLSSAAGAQDAFQGNSATVKLPSDLYGAAAPAPDLEKYLSADGRFIDECRYWHDHPDPTTLLYGWPAAFPPGQIGQTEGVNGQPAPYVRCAVNPCPQYGYICWRNPAKPTTLTAQLQAVLRAQGCEAEPNGDIYCQKDRMPHPGPPSPTLSSGLVKSVCRVIGTGISCDPNPNPGPGNDSFNGGTPSSETGVAGQDYIRQSQPRPQPVPKYAPLDWSKLLLCTDTSSSPNGGPYINYFRDLIHNDAAVSWMSDSRYITVGGHGGPGMNGVGACPWSSSLVPPQRIATDVHTALMLPGNANKKVRLAVCDSADPNPKDPNSAPLAQQVADAYRELFGTPIAVEGYSGNVPYGLKTRLQGLPCRVFTSRTPLPAD